MTIKPNGKRTAPQRKGPKTFVPTPLGPLFFSLDRAEFENPSPVTRVISITMPIQCLQDRQALGELVLKKVLHKPFEPMEGEVQHATSSATHGEESDEETPYTVIHIKSIEVRPETVHQANANGDLRMNVATELIVARVHHGLVVGVAEPSVYPNCVQVRIAAEDSTVPPSSSRRRARDSDGHITEPGDGGLLLTVRSLEEEPVVPGLAVLVVSEPSGSVRCMTVRPPRRAPGPFRVVLDPTSSSKGMMIECDMPPKGTDQGNVPTGSGVE